MRKIIWSTGTLETVRSWPKDAKDAAGLELRRLQEGFDPVTWKQVVNVPVKLKNIREIRIKMGEQYRIIYVTSLPEGINVVHAFQKKSQKTSKKDIDVAARAIKRLEEKGSR